jgi:hypothetical protein
MREKFPMLLTGNQQSVPEATRAAPREGRPAEAHGYPPCDSILISTAAQHPKEHQKEIDEIQIKSEGTDDGVGTRALFRHRCRH